MRISESESLFIDWYRELTPPEKEAVYQAVVESDETLLHRLQQGGELLSRLNGLTTADSHYETLFFLG